MPRMRPRKILQQSVVAEAARPDPRTVSILITARNYSRFLRQAIQSALTQTRPCEVIYSDDCSEDDSVEVARTFEPLGLTVLSTSKHLGVCEARNRAVAASHGEYLVHLDGDDWLPPTFVEDHLRAMTAGCPFTYGPALAVGEGDRVGTLWKVPPWDKYDLWAGNTVNTSAMYARWAFLGAGGWRNEIGTMWDWSLAIRASRFGTPRPSEATLNYRQHPHSWSHAHREFFSVEQQKHRMAMRRSLARLSVGSILSGRLPGLFPEWLDRICESLKWLRLPSKSDLTLLDNSGSPHFASMVRREVSLRADNFSAVRVIQLPERVGCCLEEKERRNRVAGLLAEAMNRLQEVSSGDAIWCVEDDVLVPAVAAAALWDRLTSDDSVAAASGCYRSRHDRRSLLAGDAGWVHRTEVPSGPSDVHFAGAGCLMFWRNRPICAPRWVSHVDGIPAHDWAWSAATRQLGGRIVLCPGARCGHAVSVKEIVAA